MSNQLLPSADELVHASSTELLEAALELASHAFDRARTDAEPMTKDQLLEQASATQRVANSALATQAVRIAQAASYEEIFDPQIADTRMIRHHLGFADQWIDTEIAPLLGLGTRQAGTRIQQALDAVTDAPRLLTESGTGGLDPMKVGVVTDLLIGTSRRTKHAVERALLDQRITHLTTTQLRRRIPQLIAELEPAALTPAAKKRRRRHIGVFTRPHHEPGLAQLVAILPTQDIATAHHAIDDLARQLHTDTTTDKTLPECRADAFIDLLLRNVAVDTTVQFQLPVRPTTKSEHHDATQTRTPSTTRPSTGDPITDELNALLDDMLGVRPAPSCTPPDTALCDEEDLPDPAWLDDYRDRDIDWHQLLNDARSQSSPPDGDTAVRTRAAPTTHQHRSHDQHQRREQHQSQGGGFTDVLVPGVGVIPAAVVLQLSRAVGTRITRALTDPATGTTAATTTHAYRPTAAIRSMVTTRDQHCRFPGCSIPATSCELDHVDPWPHGDTTPANLHCLCRHHHRAKHETGWHLTMTTHGTCTWTSPSGHTYTTTPGD